MLRAKELRRILHAFADAVCDEAARNPEFAGRLAALLDTDGPTRPKVQKSKRVLDPFQVLADRGGRGLRAFLQDLPIHELRTVVRTHRLDPTRLSDKWKTKERFVDFVLDRVEARAKQGDVFRQYGSRREEQIVNDKLVPIPTESVEKQQPDEEKKESGFK
jgi:hypothetical protein